MFARLTGERALGSFVAAFIVLIAISVSLSALAISKSVTTAAQVRDIAVQLQPTAAERRARLEKAIHEMSPAQKRELYQALKAAARSRRGA